MVKEWRLRLYRLMCIALSLALSFLSAGPSAQAFGGDIHREITREGLGATPNDSFLRTAVRRSINHQHAWMDAGFPSTRGREDQRHFDDCEFDGSVAFIRDSYRSARLALINERFWAATAMFGNILHTVQDFYSHSNWVEMGFPVTRDSPETAAVEVAQSDLVDLSGAQLSLAQNWFAPAGGVTVRGDILLGADDWAPLPAGWSIKRNGAGRFVPTLVDAQGRTRGRLLETGKGSGDDECNVETVGGVIYTGIKHDNLNKDNPTSGANDVPLAERRSKHAKARALATLQTGYEWCRLVREAGLVGKDSLLLALWVRAGGNPHPPGTPCRQLGSGPAPIVVTIESIQILNSGDGNGEPGEIQLAAVLYDNPQDFHRSLHVANRQGRMQLRTGEFVPNNQIPAPFHLCVSQDSGATFALLAWDNDDPLSDEYAYDFDNYGDDDEVLVGIQRKFGSQLPAGIQVARSNDLEVRFRVSRTADGLNQGLLCPPENRETEK